jgi:hypothetical protein
MDEKAACEHRPMCPQVVTKHLSLAIGFFAVRAVTRQARV